MSNKTLYVREQDLPLWARAEQFARSTSQSLSQLIANLIRNHLPQQPMDVDRERP